MKGHQLVPFFFAAGRDFLPYGVSAARSSLAIVLTDGTTFANDYRRQHSLLRKNSCDEQERENSSAGAPFDKKML
jgi:hypothetical protein